MTDGDLVKVEMDGKEIVSIVLVGNRAEATHVVYDSWHYKDNSRFGIIIEDIDGKWAMA